MKPDLQGYGPTRTLVAVSGSLTGYDSKILQASYAEAEHTLLCNLATPPVGTYATKMGARAHQTNHTYVLRTAFIMAKYCN